MKTKAVVLDEEQFPPFEGFPKEGLEFFKRLAKNNNREWFEKHKHEYESYAKFPMQSLIASLRPHFARFAPEFDLNPKRSIFRIYRDVRFSNDKTPYKTNIAAHFVLGGKPKGFLGSGYYLHIEPAECFIGGGIYMPESDQLKKIRKGIATRGDEFLTIIQKPSFKKMFGVLTGNKLQRIPKGYDESDPMAEWLKLKQFFVGISMKGDVCLKRSFSDTIAKACEEAEPLVRFLNSTL